MDYYRFIPHLEEIEPRDTPATGLTPEQVFGAAGLAGAYYHGTQAALLDPSFIRLAANRSPTQAIAATVVAQTADLTDVLSGYVVELQQEEAVAGPANAGSLQGLIRHFEESANFARLAGLQAQAVSGLIDQFNAADAARAASASGSTGATSAGTTGAGSLSTGVAGVSGVGTSTGTVNTLPTTGTTTGTTTTGTDTTGSTGAPTTGSTSATTAGATSTGSGVGSTSGTGSTQSVAASPGASTLG